MTPIVERFDNVLTQQIARRLLITGFALTAGLWVSGCGGTPDQDPNQNQKFTVTYDVTGTFDTCHMVFLTTEEQAALDEQGESNNNADSPTEDGMNIWTYTFEVTVTPDAPFDTQIRAECTASETSDVDVRISVDGQEVESTTATGQDVSPELTHQLVYGQ